MDGGWNKTARPETCEYQIEQRRDAPVSRELKCMSADYLGQRVEDVLTRVEPVAKVEVLVAEVKVVVVLDEEQHGGSSVMANGDHWDCDK